MSEEENKIHGQLKELLESGGKWARLASDIEGLYVVRMPKLKDRPAKLALEVNPIIPSTGRRHKKKSLFITTEEQLLEYVKIFQSDIVKDIIKHIEEINGENKEVRHGQNVIGKLETD